MERIDKILLNREFLLNLQRNEEAETNRKFCNHQMEHFLDVARIAAVINLEEHYDISKELIYAASLLHDIGRHRQYHENITHDIASAEIAPGILAECGFSKEEIEVIVDAILNHRKTEVKNEKSLRGLLYRADKASRPCFSCKMVQECNWENEKKNLKIVY